MFRGAILTGIHADYSPVKTRILYLTFSKHKHKKVVAFMRDKKLCNVGIQKAQNN